MAATLRLSATALLVVLGAADLASTAIRTRAGPEDMPSENRFNFFDAEILQSVANVNRGNVVLSPIGIKTLLGMVLEGAGGRSAEQIRTALRLPERQDAIRLLFLNYLTKIREPSSGIKMEIGSSVFMSNRLTPSQEYVGHLLQYYANLVKTDFANPNLTARQINSWINDVTRGLIPKLIDPENLQPDAQALLTNAIYFKGRWKIPFDPEATKVKCFYTSPGVCHQTNIMDTLEFFKYSYIQELNADALELPYQGEKFSMLLLAPKEIDGIVQLQRDISHFPVHSIVNTLETTEVLVSIPRFEINFSTDLVPYLHNLGIQDIFGPNSNLSGMFERNENTVQVSNVYHKAKIIVNEAGSEAAAGTGALVIPLMGSTVSKFRADRPFLFFIRDTAKGITLFAGRVSVPEAASPQYERPKPQTSTSPSNIENSEDALYGIFTTKPSQSSSGSVQNYRPPVVTRRPMARPTSRPARPTGTPAPSNEGTQNLYLNQNSSSSQNSQNSNILFASPGTNKLQPQSSPQHVNTQSSFSQPEENTQSFKYPQDSPQSTDRQFTQSSAFAQNPQILQQQQTLTQTLPYAQSYNRPVTYVNPNTVNQPQPIPTQNWPGHQNVGQPQYSQNTDRQTSLRDGNTQALQPSRDTQYFNTQNIQQPLFNAQFQPGKQPSYSQPHITGNIGVYSTSNRASQPASSLPSYTGVVRNENSPPAQGYETTSRQSHIRVGDQIVFQNQRNAHSSSN